MFRLLRVLPLAFLALVAHAQTEPLPSIFAPRREPVPRSRVTPPPPPTPVSEHMRNRLLEQSARALASAKPFQLPAPGARHSTSTLATDGESELIFLPRYIVREQALRTEDLILRPPPIQWGTLRSEALERPGDSRLIAGETINVLRFGANKEINFNLLQMSGKGLDHGRDTVRAEIEFKLRF